MTEIQGTKRNLTLPEVHKSPKDFIEFHIFDAAGDQHGGFNQFMQHVIWYLSLKRLDILELYITFHKLRKYEHQCFFYDWYHHSLVLWFITLNWIGSPHKETPIEKDEL